MVWDVLIPDLSKGSRPGACCVEVLKRCSLSLNRVSVSIAGDVGKAHVSDGKRSANDPREAL